ncbi:hypothetical protein ES705_03273 [subsurface metagenome]|jgi:hypothetical protein
MNRVLIIDITPRQGDQGDWETRGHGEPEDTFH